MAAPTAAALAARLKGDNRTVVGSADPADPTKEFVAAGLGPVGAGYGLATVSTETAAAFSTGVTAGEGKVTVAPGNGGKTKNDLRTQYFHTLNSYDSSKVGFGAKRCFVNDKGQPLDANAEPTTVALAVDAETTDLGPGLLTGTPVTSYAQTHGPNRTPVPGVYSASPRATSLYAPYVGWTAQH